MAGTIKVNYDYTIQNGAYVSGPTYVRAEYTQTNPGGPSPGTVTVTTTAASISHSLSTLGFAKFTNLDDTNFVKIGNYSGGTLYPFLKLKPGESTPPIRLMPGITLGAQADTANCKVNVEIYED